MAPAALEQRYVEREVIYLLGTLDTNPEHPAARQELHGEGARRHARGHAYAEAMAKRNHGPPNHRILDVPGVGHDGEKMLTSRCGLAALFDSAGCGAER
ncbi:hypothetical protein [Bradyrhizobium sp. 137]|uniref:hypothetical protein n=1 Tax=Bradyrhizobium sp. 137 TaxID=2782614 RepID=UPI001FFA0C94|nr:hypothetical protein [Bradyrhizobium sp. 137]